MFGNYKVLFTLVVLTCLTNLIICSIQTILHKFYTIYTAFLNVFKKAHIAKKYQTTVHMIGLISKMSSL